MPIGIYERKNLQDLTGFVKGELTVCRAASAQDFNDYPTKQNATEKRLGSRMWLVECSCGKQLCISTLRLKNHGIKSCGCKRRRGLSKRVSNPNDPTDQARWDCFRGMRHGAATRRSREIAWELTFEQFSELTAANCHYCGREPHHVFNPKKNHYRSDIQPQPFVHSGIDRVDSGGGYVYSNCVPCCVKCNQAKNDLTVPEFKEAVSRIYNHFIDNGLLYNG